MNTGERRVHEMINKFGVDIFKAGIVDLLDYAEAQARAVVRNLPDGEYFFADYMDEDSENGFPCRLALNLIIKDDTIKTSILIVAYTYQKISFKTLTRMFLI